MRLDQAIAIAKGAATHLPFAYSLFGQKRMTAGGVAANYCYGVWFKHLLLLNEIARCGVPGVVAELGPGDTVGVGVVALLSGAQRYIGVDARPFAATGANIAIAASLVRMFQDREPLNPSGWPDFRHLLDSDGFPSTLLTEEALSASLARDRLGAISSAVRQVFAGGRSDLIVYSAPLSDPSLIEAGTVDLVLSHSVLEHVVDLQDVIANSFRWLRPGGYASHQFDLTSHGIVRDWDGHREFGRRAWDMVVGTRPFMINRLPYSAVVDTFTRCGFRLPRNDRLRRATTVPRSALCRDWREVSDDDLETSGGYVVAQKPQMLAA